MPTYSFRDKDTNLVFEKFLSFQGREEYLQQNPHIEQIHTTAPAFTGDHISAVKRHDTGFKEVLQKINERKLNKHISEQGFFKIKIVGCPVLLQNTM